MNPLNLIATLRKFGNFLVGLFPFLAVFGDKLSRLTGVVWLQKFIGWLKAHDRLAPVGLALERFLWKDYARDRLVIDTYPPGSLAMLRISSLVSLALVLLMPFTLVLTKPAVPVEWHLGTVSSAPLWAVCLWMLAAPLGWSAIMAGAVQCHRIIFVTLSVATIYFVGCYTLFAGRSYFNFLLPMAMLLAINFSGQRLVHAGGARTFGAILSAIAVGIPTGMFMFILSPLGPIFKPNSLLWGGATGAVLGVIALLCFNSDKPAQPVEEGVIESAPAGAQVEDGVTESAPDPDVPLPNATAAVVPMTLVMFVPMFAFVCSIVLRAGPRPFAEELVTTLQLWNGYLWPLWYFVGVGIVYKVLKNAKIVTNTVRDLLPEAIFKPLSMGLILTFAIILWSPTVGTWFVPPHPLAPVGLAAQHVQKLTQWFWQESLNRYSSDWMCWIILFDLVAIVWMLARKQLTTERLATLSYFTVLTWLLIYEYSFQRHSFGNAPGHNVFLVIVFSIWLLWLFHTSVFSMCSQQTKSWPTAGRLGLYCGVTTLTLLYIHARTAVHDFTMMNEIFITMFQGIIAIGFPYLLYVLSVRRFQSLPIRVLRIFQCFCAGALLTFPFNVSDKLALSDWSYYKYNQLCNQLVAAMSQSGQAAPTMPILPESWLAIRAALYVAAVVGVFVVTKNHLKNSRQLSAALIFALLSFASGFGSFSQASVDLPVPPLLKVMVSPFFMSLNLDSQWLFTYMAALLPVMFFLLCVTAAGAVSKMRMAVAAAGAVVLNFAFLALYPGYEVYLTSTGLLTTVSIGAATLFLYIIFRLTWRLERLAYEPGAVTTAAAGSDVSERRSLILEEEEEEEEEEERDAAAPEPQVPSSGAHSPVLGKLELNVIGALTCIILIAMGIWQAQAKRLVVRDVPSLNRNMKLPLDWTQSKTPTDRTTVFSAPGDTLNATLEIGTLPSNPQGVEVLATNLIKMCIEKQVLPHFAPVKFEHWKEIPSNPVACYFTFTTTVSKVDLPRMGLTVLVPRDAEKTEFYTLSCSPSDMEARMADVRRIVRSTTGSAHSTP